LFTEAKSRSSERAAVKTTRATTTQSGGGGLFSRLRETFTGR